MLRDQLCFHQPTQSAAAAPCKRTVGEELIRQALCGFFTKSILQLRIVVGGLALLLSGTLSSAQSSAANAISLETIRKAYAENPVNADLLYKGKVLTVEGIVTAITSNPRGREVGSVSFASPPEVKRRFGDETALQGAVGASGVTIWSCSFDASRVEEIARLRKNDNIILEGQLESYSTFRHCRVVTKEAAPP